MKVLVTGSAHLLRDSDGNYYSPSIYSYDFFRRYLNVFDTVRFAAKVKYVETVDKEKCLLVSGDNLEIYEIPWYQGIRELAMNLIKVMKAFKSVSDGCECSIYRMAQIESYFAFFFRDKRKKYAVELVNDPDTFMDIPIILRKMNVFFTKQIINKAIGVSYVTKNYLQKKYPSKAHIERNIKGDSFTSYYSSIELLDSDIKSKKKYSDSNSTFEIIHISNAINNDIKGHTTLIEAIKIVVEQGYDVRCKIVGDGRRLEHYKEMVEKFGLSDRFIFTGRLYNRESVLQNLSKSDLLVLPTKMEGLPRTIIESMAVGLPCISTPIAGIPELLEEKYLFELTDFRGFAKEIIRLINNHKELEKMSERNIEIAKKYTKKKLERRRNEFYKKLRASVE